jgi:hypothetical protein
MKQLKQNGTPIDVDVPFLLVGQPAIRLRIRR